MSTNKPSVTCPLCRKKQSSAESGIWPFCSERCKEADLGHWANEDYRIPVRKVEEEEDVPGEGEEDDGESSDSK